MIYKSADQLIGKTPLLELTHIEEKLNLKPEDTYYVGDSLTHDVIGVKRVG